MTNKIESFITKLGAVKGVERKRIWIEGARLQRNGFPRGTVFIKEWTQGGIAREPAESVNTLYLAVIDKVDIHTSRPCKVSGKGDHPIIDITSNDVPTFFEGFSHVKVEFQQGMIRITGHTKC